jgi:single-stranded-DNA-specific exonuclease
VVGIVAGRLASKYGKPTVIIGFAAGHPTEGRGSVRGPAGFSLYQALGASKDALLGFGGHDAAAGVHVEASRIATFRDRFAEACVGLGLGPPRPHVPLPDSVLDPGDEPARVFRDLERFEPCGQANSAPLLEVRARVAGTRVMKERHLAVELQIGRASLRAFAFDLASRQPVVGSDVRVVGRLRRDDFRGNGAVEIRMESLEPA